MTSHDSVTGTIGGASALQRQAKIVCTIGPACDSEEMIRQLMHSGMDVARLNFSHGKQEHHATVITRLRKVARELDRTICILQDLQGPKIRTGKLKDGVPVALAKGQTVTITTRDVPGTSTLIPTGYRSLASDVKPGERILLSDGRIELVVLQVRGDDVQGEVVNGGTLAENQGINLPGTNVRIPSLTEKDEADLQFGLKNGVDLVALSFVRTAQDITRAREIMREHGKPMPLIAKLEKPQAIENLDSILEVTNGVMVARGDLGVELAPEKVPLIQKRIIRRARDFRRPVITATQMLESMIANPRPTRAEASDVANAILDGTDAVMLSGETAVGRYPQEAAEMMSRIVVEAEAQPAQALLPHRETTERLSIAETLCEAVAHAARDLNVRAIAVFTETADTARMLSKYRPSARVFAFTPHEGVCNRMNLLGGVTPALCPPNLSAEAMADYAETELTHDGVLVQGDIFGVVAGAAHTVGATNFLRLIAAGARRDRGEADL
jgi:pyruvate kinase